MDDTPTLTPPDWGRSNADVVPALTWGMENELIPADVASANATVLLVLDSLGAKQLETRTEHAPTLAAMSGGAATTVAPSTTAAALTSISTGVAPGEHGIVGYRFPAGGAVMNALRWTTAAGDHRDAVPPQSVQTAAPFAGGKWSVISGREFATSGFTDAHLGGMDYIGYHHPSSIAADVRAQLDAGNSLVYAYYDGLDHIAHIHGISGPHFEAELRFCDWLVAEVIAAVPSGTAVVVTADHGQIDAAPLVPIGADVMRFTRGLSGEPRFRWLHSRPGANGELLAAAIEAHGGQAWVHAVDDIISRGWFGPRVSDAARSRLGDVALIAHAPVGFDDPDERHADKLLGRHGSLTEAEMLVPVLHTVV